MAKRSRKRGVSLPWEERTSLLSEIFSLRRWRTLILVAGATLGAFLIWQRADLRARTRATRVAIADVQRAIAHFREDFDRCPRSMVELVHPPSTSARYLEEMPRDGWGRELWVRCPGKADPETADVISSGPSGSLFVDDNVQ